MAENPGHGHARLVAGWRVMTCLTSVAASVGCAALTDSHYTPTADLRTFDTGVALHGTSLDLHVAVPPAPVSQTIVVYATGDGGWFGAAVGMFHAIAAQGYRTVGFSSRAFLRLERPRHEALNPRQLAADYDAILGAARTALGLPPATPVILTGWSRGAAFAALAGSEPALGPHTAGVVAIGLAADENLQIDEGDSDDGPGASPADGTRVLLPYARLRQLGSVRSAVIQAERDDYLAAAQSRQLFGADTATRRLYAVPATNHRFSGQHAAFVAALADALAWVDAP